jgi:hypothetical protein
VVGRRKGPGGGGRGERESECLYRSPACLAFTVVSCMADWWRQVLAQQQLALQKLTELVQNAVFDADVMRQGLGLLGASERER